jgi:CRP-like cAMP-binding protein
LSVGEYLWRQGEESNEFYLIGSGEVAIGILIPHQGLLQIDAVGAGEVVGWSWFVAPYRSHFDARAMTSVDAVALQTRCLRQSCERDRELRCELLSRIAPIVVRRLEASQRKLIELHYR